MTQVMGNNLEERGPIPVRRPFREVALASGLVAVTDLNAAEAGARAREGNAAGMSSAEDGERRRDEAVARILVEQRLLTSFQVREMLAGRTRFRLGQYTVVDEIGRGGMGQVFKAEHALMGRLVAVKVLPRAKATPESEAAFRREMRILGRLDHENVVRAFDAGYDAQVYYLVTELVPGLDLRRQVRKYGPLDEVCAAAVFTQAARALAFAHAQGIVHRDVKPGNILVMDDGRVKLLDLGLAGSTLEAEAQQLGRVVGTMDYIAPEQIRTPDQVGPAADIYALGCSLYFALTGEVPFPGGDRKDKMRRHLSDAAVPIQRLAPHVTQSFCQVVEAMMAKSVAARIGSADEVIQRLARWTPDRPVPVSRTSRPCPPGTNGQAATGSSTETWSESEVDAPVWLPETDSPGSGQGATPGETDDTWREWDEFLEPRSLLRIAAFAAQVIVPAAFSGVVLAVMLWAARSLDPPRFDGLFGGFTPSGFGWVAFFVMALAQLAHVAAGRRR